MMPITVGTLSEEDITALDIYTNKLGIRVGCVYPNNIRKLYINDKNVGYALTYTSEIEFSEALEALLKQYEGE
jgi:hypothetical protein